jgi:signal peptidase II
MILQLNPWMKWLTNPLLVILLDQWSKMAIVQHFVWGQSESITSFFNLVRVHNTGAAFSFLADAGGWQHWFFILIGIGVSLFMLWLIYCNPHESLLCGALSLIIGGAIGNVIDRIQYGYVVDMLDFHARGWHFPAFNLADSAITAGAFLLILHECCYKKS